MTVESMLQHIYSPQPYLREIPPALDFRTRLPLDPAAPSAASGSFQALLCRETNRDL